MIHITIAEYLKMLAITAFVCLIVGIVFGLFIEEWDSRQPHRIAGTIKKLQRIRRERAEKALESETWR
jgi:hypothetical protein